MKNRHQNKGKCLESCTAARLGKTNVCKCEIQVNRIVLYKKKKETYIYRMYPTIFESNCEMNKICICV